MLVAQTITVREMGGLRVTELGTATPADGEKFTLQEMQAVVDGLIEPVYLPDGRVMIVNEEGWVIKLPVNQMASLLAEQPIAGSVIVLDRRDWDDDPDEGPDGGDNDDPPICNGVVCPFPDLCDCEREAREYDDHGDGIAPPPPSEAAHDLVTGPDNLAVMRATRNLLMRAPVAPRVATVAPRKGKILFTVRVQGLGIY